MISIQDIEKLAILARVHIEDAEKESLAQEIDAILAYVDQLKKAPIDSSVKENALRNVFRDDESPHESAIFTDKLLEASPDRDGQYFKVKKILN